MGNRMMTLCTAPAVLDDAPENKAAEAVDKPVAANYDADDDCGLQEGAPPRSKGKGGLKMKIVLSKAELEWLMMHLKEEKGGRVEGAALEQALEEIQKGRKREKQGRPWRPSLDRILECPETQNFDDDRVGR